MIKSLINPTTQNFLVKEGNELRDSKTNSLVATIVNGIPRFIDNYQNYAESFGWQWNKWHSVRSSKRSNFDLGSVIKKRTHFDEYKTNGKNLLECGMGGGDDTEILLNWPFSEVHSFDLSNSVERASKFIDDQRLLISQASIFEIPYPDNSFDFVYCHRVLQHTPNPKLALHLICKKVKPGGILFAHSYNRSFNYMMEWRYKYRWLTKRLPRSWILTFLERLGSRLHDLNFLLYNKGKLSRFLAYNFIPFYYKESTDAKKLSTGDLIELEKLISFDALTPKHDHPMKSKDFFGIIEREGFTIEHKCDHPQSPLYATARKKL